MSPFDEDPSENKSRMDLCIDEIHNLQTQLATANEKNKQLRDKIQAARQWQTCPRCTKIFATQL